MATMKFKRIKYSNIMSVGAQPVDIQLDSFKKTLITGTNGAGKSTMIEALCFALFGKPFRDIKKGQLVNSVNKKKLIVELWFEHSGNEYYIKRGQKPEVFEVHRNDEKLNESASAKDFQAQFESIIGMDVTSFKQVVVLGTAGYTPFMQLAAAARRRLVEDLLGIAVLGEMDKLNKAYIRELTQNIQVQTLQSDHITREINTHKQYIEQASKASADNIARYQAMYDEQIEIAKKAKVVQDQITEEIAGIVLPEDPSDALGKINTALAQLNIQIQGFERVIAMHEKGGMCPTCQQEIVPGNDSQVKGQCDHARHKRELIENKRVEYATKADEYRRVQMLIQEKKTAHAQQRAILEGAVSRAKQIRAAMDDLQKERVDNSEELAKLEGKLSEVVSEKSRLVMEKYHRGIITDMLKDSGVKATIVKKYIPYFNDRIAHYLSIMEADYVFTLDEEFNEVIKSRGRESFSYMSFSQGEKARIDLALLFTWRDVCSKVSGTKISLLVLDELFDSATDAQGVKAINSIIDSLDDNVYIISHREHDTNEFDRHLKMVKVGRFTEAH